MPRLADGEELSDEAGGMSVFENTAVIERQAFVKAWQ